MQTEQSPTIALEPSVAAGLAASPQEAHLSPEARRLSQREESVVLLAAHGLTDKEIARHLELSQRTVGTYWERIREKLGRVSRTEIVARFVRFDSGNECQGLLTSCESSLTFLSENSSDLIARFDAELNCLAVNPSWEAIQSADKIIGKNIRQLDDLFKPNSAWIRSLSAALKDGKSIAFRSRLDGIKHELRTSLLPVPADGDHPASVISITTTDCVKELLAS